MHWSPGSAETKPTAKISKQNALILAHKTLLSLEKIKFSLLMIGRKTLLFFLFTTEKNKSAVSWYWEKSTRENICGAAAKHRRELHRPVA